VLPTLRIAAATIAASTSLAGTVAPLTPGPSPIRTVTQVRAATSAAADMSLRQRVGQLFMVGTPATGANSATFRALSRRHVGNVMLTGRSYGGLRTTARVISRLQGARATDGVRLFVATDQEGGDVQVLHGPGFSEIPTALRQGQLSPARLRDRAAAWARQLRRVGVNLDLAPVVDTVPSRRAAAQNPPIGYYDREFGHTARRVGRHGVAFVRGMADGRVATSVKHFPGLGRVHANTDTASGVTDRVTTRHDRYLQPFAAAVGAGVPFVMVSTATYRRLDPRRPAAFSPYVIDTLLRGDLDFDGVVISDDLGSAEQVSAWRPGQRAVRFLRAGGDMVLTVDPSVLPAMYDAVLRRVKASRAFRAKVDHAVLRILMAKQRHHLLGHRARARLASSRARRSGSGVRRRPVVRSTTSTATSRSVRHPGWTASGRVPALVRSQQPTTSSPMRNGLVAPRCPAGDSPLACSGRWVTPTVGRSSTAPR
jgi:beta-N-acetylhexosaminidase